MRSVLLLFLVAGVVAAQSVPPRKDIPAIAKAANGAIVSIIMSDKDGHAIAQGTGFLISKDGRIVTNYHVIAEGSSAIVKLPDGAFFVVDGVLASDKARDVAVIKAHGENFRTLTLGNSDRLQVGEDVVAIGNPLSLESTVSNGIVSGIRTVEEKGGKFLQVTTPISPGSSGGPLFNMAGEVVGITTLYLEGGENLNFAIPINEAKRLLATRFSKLQEFPDEPEESTEAGNSAHAHHGQNADGAQPNLADTLAWMSNFMEKATDVINPCVNILATNKWDAIETCYLQHMEHFSADGCTVTTTIFNANWSGAVDGKLTYVIPLKELNPERIQITAAFWMDPDKRSLQLFIPEDQVDRLTSGMVRYQVEFETSDGSYKIESKGLKGKNGEPLLALIKELAIILVDKESAQRFGNALKHAVQLCGGTPSPF